MLRVWLCCVLFALGLPPRPLKKLAEEQSFAQIVAAGGRGEELGGVKPWKLRSSAEWVYVLQLEGDGFKAARKRWGLGSDRNPPFVPRSEHEALERLGHVRWLDPTGSAGRSSAAVVEGRTGGQPASCSTRISAAYCPAFVRWICLRNTRSQSQNLYYGVLWCYAVV
jgi:hypothetical protein